MKVSELRELTVEELRQREKDLKGELFNLRFQLETHQLQNTDRLRQVKRDLARAKTILGEKGVR